MKTHILSTSPNQLESALTQAIARLAEGEVVAIPTETVYGLAGHAFDESAVLKIFAAKQRPSFDPLIVHLAEQANLDLQALARQELIKAEAIPPALRPALNALIHHCWPGPLTLVLPRHPRVPDLVTSGLDTIALRIPRHPVAQALLSRSFPLAAPSANRFGRISPTTATAVYQELAGRIPLILDGGPCEIGLESTVIGIQPDLVPQLCLLRPGHWSCEELEAVCGLPIRREVVHPAEILAPGMLQSHYAPASPLYLARQTSEIQTLLQTYPGRPGLLLLQPATELQNLVAERQGKSVVLSATGQISEAARNLFAGLRQLDGLDFLLAEIPHQTTGLGHAIRDRLFKAAGLGKG